MAMYPQFPTYQEDCVSFLFVLLKWVILMMTKFRVAVKM